MNITPYSINEICDRYNTYLRYFGYQGVQKYRVSEELRHLFFYTLVNHIPFDVDRVRYNQGIQNFRFRGKWYKVCNPIYFKERNEENVTEQ